MFNMGFKRRRICADFELVEKLQKFYQKYLFAYRVGMTWFLIFQYRVKIQRIFYPLQIQHFLVPTLNFFILKIGIFSAIFSNFKKAQHSFNFKVS
jgi:hypothetical protein